MSASQRSASPKGSFASNSHAHRTDPSPWAGGLSTFAGVMMIIVGVFGAIEGLVALFRNEVYVVGLQYVFAFDLTTWGWIHLIVGSSSRPQASRSCPDVSGGGWSASPSPR